MKQTLPKVSNEELLKTIAPLELAGFPVWKSYRGLAFHVAGEQPVQEQFLRFQRRVAAAIGREYLPVYRMADGEFSFLVGWRAPIGQRVGLARTSVWAAKEFAARLGRRSVWTCWGETYAGRSAKDAHARMVAGIELVASKGVIAAYFARRGDRWGEQYIEPVWRWFDARGVLLGQSNYVPFYFVYALLSGPGRDSIWKGRRVLVATSLRQSGRRDAIVSGLIAEGAAKVGFIEVSPSASMFDEVRLPAESYDLALVAAGIGSVNILTQLAPLKIPAIDCGIVLECLIDPARRRERPFLLPEE